MATITCAQCKNTVSEDGSRMYKGDRICHNCYKATKKDRDLERMARGL